MRPRLAAMASSNGSNACTSALTRDEVASKVAGKLLFCELVHTHRDGDAAGAALSSAMLLLERVQRIVSCGWPLALEKVASLPVAVEE
jgi:hypothetical protein